MTELPTPGDPEASEVAELSRGIQAAWGRRPALTRGPKRELTLERIVAAGVDLADAEGLAGVSMSRVAAALGTGAMSLYRYVSDKDELLKLMVDAAYGPPPDTRPPAGDWRAGLTWWAGSQLDAMLRHPWAVRVPIPGPPTTPNTVSWLDQGLRCLAQTPLDETQKMSVLLLLTGYARNEATLTADLDAAFVAGTTPQAAMSRYGRILNGLIAGGDYAGLRAVIDSGFFDAQDDPPDAEFRFGLGRILDGIERLLEVPQAERLSRAAAPATAPR